MNILLSVLQLPQLDFFSYYLYNNNLLTNLYTMIYNEIHKRIAVLTDPSYHCKIGIR